MTVRHSRLITWSWILALMLLVAACGGGSAETTTTTAAGTEETTTTATTAPSGEETTTTTEVVSSEPIKIGFLSALTGPFAAWGIQVRDGMRMAVAEINAADGIGGRQLELVEQDTQSDPEAGSSALERLIEQDGVVFAGGIISSGVGLSTARVAEELQVPLYLVKAGSDAILTQDSRFTFRTCLPAAPMVAGPIAQYIQSEGLTRVGAIIADYEWGHAVESAIQADIGGLEGVELQIEVAPVPEQDFTTYLRRLQDFDPDLLVATGHPPGSGPITRQAADLGMDIPVTGAYSPLSAVVEAVGEQAYGRYSDFGCADYASEEYQDLARRYLEFSDNSFMEDDAVAAYGMVHAVAEAMLEVGDDPVAIAEYLHGHSFNPPGYSFELSWTEWGELAAAQPLFVTIAQQDPPEGVNPGADWYPETLILPDPLEPYVP